MKRLSIVVFLLTLISCNQKEEKNEQIHEKKEPVIRVESAGEASENSGGMESYDEDPEELDGPGCRFAFSETDYRKGGRYVYSDNLDSICYIKIKGEFVRLQMVAIDTSWFPIVHYAKKFKNEDYNLSIDVKKVNEEDEVSLLKGTLEIQYKNQPAEKKELYGFCGC